MKSELRIKLNQHMVRLADGDRSAFDFVYETTWPLVHSFALKMIRQTSEGDDIAQLALMKVFSRAGEFDRNRDALSWVLGITAYECKTSIQKVRRRKEDIQEIKTFDSHKAKDTSPEEQAIHNDLRTALLNVLSELKQQELETIISSVEDSVISDVKGATYRKRLQRALGSLRHKWSNRYE